MLQLPGKKGSGSTGWAIQAKVQMYLWLGIVKHRKDLLKGFPEGYEDTPLLRRACRILGSPPPTVKYTGKGSHNFELEGGGTNESPIHRLVFRYTD